MPKYDTDIRYCKGEKIPQTIWWDKNDRIVKLIDQTLLPDELKAMKCNNWRQIKEAIQSLRIRGAPALGAAGAYALALEAQKFEGNKNEFFKKMDEVREIGEARPTATNLKWGVERVYNALKEKEKTDINELKKIALKEAEALVEEDIETNKKIGENGLEIFEQFKPKKKIRILTHCHAGSLATCGYGTALGVIRAASEEGYNLQVYADETRPLLQGARITTWELKKLGISVILNPDNAAGWIMKREGIDLVVVGADRIAVNGDTANKVGTYSLSILAKDHGIPFYVAAPKSTIDLNTKAGANIKIEERNYREVTHIRGEKVAAHLGENEVKNYAFDVTPYENITGIITESGVHTSPYEEDFRKF